MTRHRLAKLRLGFALLLVVDPLPLYAQVEVGRSVSKEELVATLPPDSEHPAARELVRAYPGRLTTMRARFVSGERRGGILDHCAVFIALHAPPGRSHELVNRGVVALWEDPLYRVLYVGESELGFVSRLQTLELSSRRFRVHLLHVRYVQTGSGGIEEDLLFALAQDNRLIDVPIVHADLGHLLEQGEYFCCGSFRSFNEDTIEFTVFITRSGRPGITHKVRSRFRLQGDFEYDPVLEQYVPSFRLVADDVSGREPN